VESIAKEIVLNNVGERMTELRDQEGALSAETGLSEHDLLARVRELEEENLTLRRIVVELLEKNQQLRFAASRTGSRTE
jgi:DNA-binding Lrp family transcriptional regulator